MSDPWLPEEDDEAPPKPRRGRRGILIGIGAAAVVGTTAVAFSLRSRGSKQAVADGSALAQQAYAALRDGAIARAVDLATRARAADPDGVEPTRAWLHATGMDLMEGNADGPRAVGFVAEARKLGFQHTDLAFATVASAVAMKNDRFARRLVDQHVEQDIATDAFYDFAAGAAFDLDCDPESAEARFKASAAQWVDAVLPRLRRARAFAFADQFDDARDELDALPTQGLEASVLSQVIDRLAEPGMGPGYVDPMAMADLPRSLRPLGQALMLAGDSANFGIDAALGDLDTPLVAVSCAKIALGNRDLVAAERSLEAARAMRSELSEVAGLLVYVKLLRGDLLNAREVATGAGDTELVSLVAAITAYEERKVDAIERAVNDAEAASASEWPLVDAAEGLLGKGPMPTEEELSAAVESGEPWADLLLVDLALKNSSFDLADRIIRTWSDKTPPREQRRKAAAERGGSSKKP